MKYLYWIYQLIIAVPVAIIATILTAAFTGMGCTLGNGHFWGYWPGHIWGKVITWAFLLPVKVEGRENIEEGHSYVFVANHQVHQQQDHQQEHYQYNFEKTNHIHKALNKYLHIYQLYQNYLQNKPNRQQLHKQHNNIHCNKRHFE